MIDFIINGESALRRGFYLEAYPEIPSSVHLVESISVPGREHGALTKFNGWQDIVISLTVNLYNWRNVKSHFRELVGWLHAGAGGKLAFSNEPELYYKIKSVSLDNFVSTADLLGTVPVSITCDPFIYQDAVPMTITEFPKKLNNHGTALAEPTFTLFGTGALDLMINGDQLKITGVKSQVTIDSEQQMAYEGTTNLETAITGDWPTLAQGVNEIDAAFVTKIKLVPNWRWLT